MLTLSKSAVLAFASILTLGVGDAAAQADGATTDGRTSEPATAPSDPEIAHIAVTANAIDIELAELAQSRASDPRVVRFAETMIADHTAVNERAAALAERLGVTPEDNPVSRGLREGAAAARAKLERRGGTEFDRAYIEREVAYHQAVLDALDGVLIPSAENAELRALLEEVRPAIAAHLKHAQSIASLTARDQ